jgi:uncharacterized delta-60 repeat protein
MKYIGTDGRKSWLVLFAWLLPLPLLAQAPGALDISFGVAGTLLTPIGTDNDEVGDMAVQSDGKIVVAGHTWEAGLNAFAVARYLPDGALDPSFDGDGLAITPFAGLTGVTHAVAVQPDGKILVGGYVVDQTTSQFSLALLRYLPNGSLDTSFSGDGKLTANLSGSEVYEILLQPDGKIVVVATNVLARFLANGTLDVTFGVGGVVSVDFSQLAGALQPDGKIVVAGQAWNTTTFQYEFVVGRYLPNGTFDPAFAGGGSVTTNVDDGSVRAVLVQPDGKIIVAGHSYTGGTGHVDFTLVRHLPDGTLDPSFGGDGLVSSDFGSVSTVHDLLLQPDGRILAGGYAFLAFALARYLPDGSLDLTFSDDGLTMTTFGPNDSSFIQGMALQPQNGRLVAAGSSTRTGEGGFDFALAGYATGLVPGIGPPTRRGECKHGGWREFTIPRAFISEADCIRFVKTGH